MCTPARLSSRRTLTTHGIALAGLATVQLAIAAPATAGPYSGLQRQLAVTVPRVEATITIDGVLDEPVWEQAARLVDFSQYAPVDGRPAAQSTEVLVWYSPTAMHFGIRAQAMPGTVRATLADRDRLDSDDQVHIFLGTFNDDRQALVFAVNPLGVQLDGTLVEGLQTQGAAFSGLASGREPTNLSPDFVYYSRGRITADGFDVEMRIPFKSLRYPGTDPQTWSINVVRRVQESGHEDSWAPARRNAASFVAQSGRLEGLTGLRRGLVVDLNPVVTARTDGLPSPDGWRYDAASPEAGLNVRWGITSNLTLNGTVNPDFSQVESDAGQVAFDPRSALFFAEKRPFFLDGSEQFAAPNNLIHTRRIVAPVAAAKVAGKVSGTSVGFLAAVDDEAQSGAGDNNPIFAILRVQRDVGGQSSLGLLYTGRTEDDASNHVGGADARLVFGGIYNLQLQGAVATTSRQDAARTAPLWQAVLARNGRRYSFRSSLRGIDPDFRTAAGFISRPGIVSGRVTNQVTFYGAKGAWWERATGDVALDGTWLYDEFTAGRGPQDRKLHLNLNSALRGGWKAGASVLIETFGYDRRLYADYAILLPGPHGASLVPYRGTPHLGNFDYVVSFGMPPRRGLTIDGWVLWGRDENFFEWSSADIALADVTVQWRPIAQLRADASWKLQSYRRRSDDSIVGRRTIPRVKVEYQVTRAIFLRGVAEWDREHQDDLRDDSRTGGPVYIRNAATGEYERALGFRRTRLRADGLFSYQPVPGTVFFAGYTSLLDDGDGHRRERLGRTADGFFVKLSYLWRL
jgi:hypothetical protein